MSNEQKLAQLKLLLGISDTSQDTLLTGYLNMAKAEILNWMYINVGAIPSTVTDVPTKYEQIQIMACVSGFNLNGAENQTSHNENGISRSFRYSSMVDYIHSNVYPLV